MNLDAVAEGDELSVILVGFNLFHFARLRHLGDERLILHLFLQWLDVFSLHFSHPLEEVFLGGQDIVFLVGSEHGNDKVTFGHLLHELVDEIHGSGRYQLIHGVVFPFDACHRLVVEEMAHTFIHITVALHLVAVEVSTLDG